MRAAGRLILHRMSTGRSRNAAQTRADILDAARRRFGSDGYQTTTLRAVAADVGIDPALIIRYFGTKQELFAEAADHWRGTLTPLHVLLALGGSS